MFTLRKLRHESKERDGIKEKLVVIPGHVLCMAEDGTYLTSNDDRPVSHTQMTSPDGALDITCSDCPLVRLLYYTEDPHKIILIFRNGKAELWSYSLETYSWSCHGNIMLFEDQAKVEVIDAMLHESQNAIYWAENEVGCTSKVTICTLALPKCMKDWCRSDEGPERVELLSNCPPCQLYPLGDSLLIFPRRCSPPGVYLKWVPSHHSIQLHVAAVGLVITEKKQSHVLNFYELVSKATAAWQQAEAITEWRVLPDVTRRRIVLINPNADVYLMTDKTQLTLLTRLQHKHTWQHVRDCHLLFGFLIAVSEQDVRVYGLEGGEQIQRLCVGVDALVSSWSSHSTISMVGICTQHAAYQIQLLPSNQWGPEIQQRASHFLKQLQMPLPASLHALEQIHDLTKKSSDSKPGDPDLASIIQPDLLQTPTLLLALLHEGHDYGTLNNKLHSILQKDASQHFSSATNLQQQTEASDTTYQRLEERKQQVLSSDEHMVKSHRLKDELHHVLNKMDWLPLETRCSMLRILLGQSPLDVLDILLTDLGVIKADGGSPESRRKQQLWEVILFPQAASPSVDFQLLRLICQACFKLMPQHLKNLVESAIQECDKKTSAATFMDKRNRHLICFEISRSLPSVSQSKDCRSAAMVTSWLLLESSHPGSEMEALQVLIGAGIWTEAAQIVQEHSSRGPAIHRLLFNLLLTSACKAQTLPSHIDCILEVAPPDISPPDLLAHVQEFCKQESQLAVRDKVLCDDSSTCIRLGALQSFWTNQQVSHENTPPS